MLCRITLIHPLAQNRIAPTQYCGRLNENELHRGTLQANEAAQICSIAALLQLGKERPPMNDLDLNDVRTFVAIAQAGTLTAAAKELQLPTSTVSRALTRLEKHLGVVLVQRSPRGLVLTDSGTEYLQSCRRALQTLRHGRDLLEDRRSSPSGLIKVVCPVTMARDVLASLLKEFLGRYPDLRVATNPTQRVGIRNHEKTRMCSSNCWRRRIPCGACALILARFEGFSPAHAMSRRWAVRRPRTTSPLTAA